ncbi:MAG: 4-hydroxy-3-methylbut-2-enyl diphosphate reductase [Nitrospirae bacterium]|nr:MAG: 4-hydroxy-3-methylbut-2-enyl diphosphate reductase [Nitrospirota bacterium]
MKVIVAKTAGFCFGVKRAVNIAFEMAPKKQKGIFTLGPIIHNPQLIEELRKKGLAPIEDINTAGIKTLIIRTHGIPLQLLNKISAAGYEIVDATCPFVKKAQHYAKLLKEHGYQVIILGDREHPEVQGLMSYAGKNVVVVDGKSPLPEIKRKVGIVVQTTQPVAALKKLFGEVVEQAKDVKVYNTICNSTALRLKETEEMAKGVDTMLVVGGKNSANTTQLARLCRALAVSTHHIETAAEIVPEWFTGAKRVGITAGASTPDWIIKDVVKRVSASAPCLRRRGHRRIKG